jgi:hypothetical protein
MIGNLPRMLNQRSQFLLLQVQVKKEVLYGVGVRISPGMYVFMSSAS